jgi:hypothetical protein
MPAMRKDSAELFAKDFPMLDEMEAGQ